MGEVKKRVRLWDEVRLRKGHVLGLGLVVLIFSPFCIPLPHTFLSMQIF